MARDVPVVFMTYDMLELGRRGHPRACRCRSDAGGWSRCWARTRAGVLRLSPTVDAQTWDDARDTARRLARARRRRADAEAPRLAYGVGRKRGDWWKWKIDPSHHGRGADLCAAGQRQARQPADRLHVRGLGRRRSSCPSRRPTRACRMTKSPSSIAGSGGTPASASARCATSNRCRCSSSDSKRSRVRRGIDPDRGALSANAALAQRQAGGGSRYAGERQTAARRGRELTSTSWSAGP